MMRGISQGYIDVAGFMKNMLVVDLIRREAHVNWWLSQGLLVNECLQGRSPVYCNGTRSFGSR
jgi:hypothetical protein